MSHRSPLITYYKHEVVKDEASSSPLRLGSLLSRASKLGPHQSVLTFNRSLQGSCCSNHPGRPTIATSLCRSRCYAWKLSEGRNNFFERAQLNDEITRRSDFSRLMMGAIRSADVRWFRIHDIGDFDGLEYIDSWNRIVSSLENVHFWAYTRSWRIAELRPTLVRLAGLDNMDLVFSWDRQTGTPPCIPGIPWAWFADTDGDPPHEKCHVVFRGSAERSRDEDKRRAEARKRKEPSAEHRGRNVIPLTVMNGSPVCPLERGTPVRDTYKDCITCRLCMPKARRAIVGEISTKALLVA